LPYPRRDTWRHAPGTITVQLLYKAGSIAAAVARQGHQANGRSLAEHLADVNPDDPWEAA